MATLSEYFGSRASEVLTQLEQALQQMPLPDMAGLHRGIRELRGTAQMAREERVLRAITAFEVVVRGWAADTAAWTEDEIEQARETIADLRVLIERSSDDEVLDARARAVIARWRDLAADGEHAGTGSAQGASTDSREFRDFAAREVAAIAEVLDTGVRRLTDAPMDREPLRAILQRQRTLLGAARLDEIPVVAEILRAVEDLTRVIVKLDIGVKEEWLDIYRVAREGLRSSVARLEQGLDPEPSHAQSRIRHLRAELLERYGAGEVVSAAANPLVQATSATEASAAGPPLDAGQPEQPPIEPPAVDAGERAVPIEGLTYSGDAALERALALREVIDRATAHDPVARDVVDELFDLIRLARR
jgi:hypothetical protein